MNNVAEIIDASFSKEGSRRRRGRPIAIDDGRLWGARDHLVWLFETTWPDVGRRLPWIKKPADVLEVLHVWQSENNCYNQHYIAKCLLRSSSTPATPKWLTVTRNRLGELNEAVRSAEEVRRKCRESLETAQRALRPELSDGEKLIVEDLISGRDQKLADAEAEYGRMSSKQRQTEELLRDGEASFARGEFIRFCKSNRYRLTPLNIANALAGLPYVGWRQSAKRCKKQPCAGANGGSMQIFETVRRIVESGTRRSDLIKHTEQWLRARGNAKSFGVSELQKDWFYLRWALKTVLEANPRVATRDLPFAIAKEYWQRKTQPSSLNTLFAEEERIVV